MGKTMLIAVPVTHPPIHKLIDEIKKQNIESITCFLISKAYFLCSMYNPRRHTRHI